MTRILSSIEAAARSPFTWLPGWLLLLLLILLGPAGCASIRVTDPMRTADMEFLLGIPALYLSGTSLGGGAGAPTPPINTPEFGLLKSTKQRGWASIAIAAYWADTGELLAVSGPYVGRTSREDYWILGYGP